MNNMYVCYASSDYYARETGISMIGFFENNPYYEPEELFILDYGILEPNKEKLNGIAQKYGKYITYLPAKTILEDIQSKLNLMDFRGSLATYSRAFIDKIMPDYVRKLLYIDSDTVVVGSVSELKSFNLRNACMAGIVSEVFSTQIKDGKFTLYSGNKIYYGCGIVLFDIYNWRKYHCYEKIVEMLKIKKIYPNADQTLINNALPESCFCKLPRKYNYNTHILSEKIELEKLKIGGWYDENEIYDAINNTVIVHYAGLPIMRPWYNGCVSRRKEDYLKYKFKSPWANDPLVDIINTNHVGGMRGVFNKFVHRIETSSNFSVLFKLILLCRVYIGKPLRRIGVIPQLPKEGIE